MITREVMRATSPSCLSGKFYDKNAGAFYGEIVSPLNLRRVRRLTVVTGVIRDGTGTIQVTWFNMPYLKSSLVSGSRYVFRGKMVPKKTADVPGAACCFSYGRV